jgi:hypothetical protein
MSDQKDRRVHITETPDTSHIKNVDVTHEKSDVDVGSITKFVIGLLVLTIVTHIGLWGMFRMLQKYETQKEQVQHRSPLAPAADERQPPEPRLQSAPGFAESLEKAAPGQHEERKFQTANEGFDRPKDPLWEIRALRKQWNHVLEHGPTDEQGQSFGMPIEQAKEEVLKQLATKSQPADGRKQ